MVRKALLMLTDAVVVNLGILISFAIRFGIPLPEYNFSSYRRSFIFLSLIYVGAFFFFGVCKDRFRSSWDLFRRVFLGLFFGTLLGVTLVYVFRARWGAFPTTIFIISFFINLLLVFKLNQFVLRAGKRIRKKVVVIGDNNIDDIVGKKAIVERISSDDIGILLKNAEVDEVVICERLHDEKDLNLLIYLIQRLKVDVVFDPSIYVELLSGRINGDDSFHFLSTFVGGKRDIDEFLMRSLDVIGSLLILLILSPILILIALLVKATSSGPVFYNQRRVGKDGKLFTLHKFRTMIKDAEKEIGPVLAKRDDPRVTKFGRILRVTRLDELPQLINVLRGDMSLVGPRPERPHFVKQHRALAELRLAVKPGMTGFAQVRNYYDLKPRHKIKYDYLYIQKRSLPLNLYILMLTIPAIFRRKGW